MFLGISSVFSQNQRTVDSLEYRLAGVRTDSVKIQILNDLVWEYQYHNTEKGISYGKQALELAQKLDDSVAIAASHERMGVIYWAKGDYSVALEHYFIGLEMTEKQGNDNAIAPTLNNIGLIFMDMGDLDKSLEYLEKSLKMEEEVGNEQGYASSLSNIGLVYSEKKEYEKALDYFLKTLRIYEDVDDDFGRSICYNNIGDIHKYQGNYSLAFDYYSRSLEIDEGNGDKLGMAINYNSLGDVLLAKGSNNMSITYHQKSLQLYEEIGDINGLEEVYESLSGAYEKMKDFEKALMHYKLRAALKDTLLNKENSKQINEMATKYETEKKEQKITLLNKDNALQAEQLNKQKIINWSVGAGLALVLLFALVLFNRFRLIRKQKSIIEHEKQRSEELLLNILPVETAAELKETGQATPKQYEKATVLFTDFKNFTKLAENMTPVELVSELDYCFKEFDKIITKYNIEKIKTIGDAYMCAGGLPRTNKTNPVDIVMAGLEIQQFMEHWKEEKTREGKPFWEVRLGIHTGPVIAGIVGVKKFAYDIWGDTVNTASRMESSGEPGKVNISGDTYGWVKDFFECIHRGKVQAKNKGKVDMYFVERIKLELSQNGNGMLPNEKFEEMKLNTAT
ncbi:tetratricopeptide repeat protein [Bacteroidales bacterium AH-315-I05]|nr:tetratricopeptide repeat protein [Bacteroidales bacterium AH-315-I05]